MTPEEYRVAQYAISAGVAAYVTRFASMFTAPALSPGQWLNLLQMLFPEVERRYRESATLARRFYDSQRSKHVPQLPRNDRHLSELQFSWFAKNMEPARKEMAKPDSTKGAVTKLALRTVREVEMGGRRQIIHAVDDDDSLKRAVAEEAGRPAHQRRKLVQGWARVATGSETCAWCLMLIGRGPVYGSAESAGIDLDDETAKDIYDELSGDLERLREETEEHLSKWHAGCDCLVVPVFDKENWPGLPAQKHALKLYSDAGRAAREWINSGKARSDDIHKETINLLRRRLESGEIVTPTYAFAA